MDTHILAPLGLLLAIIETNRMEILDWVDTRVLCSFLPDTIYNKM